jgi:hypothetical protein
VDFDVQFLEGSGFYFAGFRFPTHNKTVAKVQLKVHFGGI